MRLHLFQKQRPSAQVSLMRAHVLPTLLSALVVAAHFRNYLHQGFVPHDFGAFYCAGNTVLHRRDPYRVEPLLDCERRLAVADRPWRTTTNEEVIPVPLPGYDFVPLAAVAALPPHIAVLIFGVLLICATALKAYCVARMSSFPALAAFAIAFMAVTYTASRLGQLAPFAIAALTAAALLLTIAFLTILLVLNRPHWGEPVPRMGMTHHAEALASGEWRQFNDTAARYDRTP